ncbi:serine hydrolase domain-containing protein [Litoribacter populi]|uniref:serine hydrolase domain-containing protein n=1 Tax=Litoribacter populi TaxID=2598460 RepID=UPI001F35697D|nr:serine hydrolase domain-containing protein [Litoribacter populi]
MKFISLPIMLLAVYACQSPQAEQKSTAIPFHGDPLVNILVALEEPDTRERIDIPETFTEESAKELENQLDSLFNFYHKRRGFNGTVMVTKYDQVIFKEAFGYADLAKKEPLTTDKAFQLASVSKQFTAMAVMILKEEGKLNYDDLVEDFLPAFPYEGITVRQLLTHRGGLSNYTYFSDELWHDRKVPITNDDVINLMYTHRPQPYYRPNIRFDYSNTGYFLLASIVEKASGISFSEFLQKRIFEPLEMENTFTYSDSLPANLVATGHERNRRKRTPDYLDTVLGDKGMYSTVEDLYKWDQALYTEKLVSRETLEEALTGSRVRKRRTNDDYGYGWRIKELNNGDVVHYHAGLWHGYNTYLLRNPKDHSTIIILSNLSNGSLSFVKELQDFLYPITPPHSIADSEQEQDNMASSESDAKKDV